MRIKSCELCQTAPLNTIAPNHLEWLAVFFRIVADFGKEKTSNNPMLCACWTGELGL
jgi:hypothetical protein